MTQLPTEVSNVANGSSSVPAAIEAFQKGQVVVFLGSGAAQVSGDRRVGIVRPGAKSVDLLSRCLGDPAHLKLTYVSTELDPAETPLSVASSGASAPNDMAAARAVEGGVLSSADFAEAATDLARLAGLQPVAILGELVGKSELVDPHCGAAAGLIEVGIEDLVRHRYRTESLVNRVSEAVIPTKHGEFRAVVYESLVDGREHIAFIVGDVEEATDVLVRVHSECLTGDIFGSLRCDCGPQLDQALERVAAAGQGVVVYLRGHEGRGIGLGRKILAYSLQDEGLDTVDANLHQGLPADSRNYGVGAMMLADLGVASVKLMTNNPKKLTGLAGYGVEIVGMVGHEINPTSYNLAYLKTKKERMGHILTLHPAGEPRGT